MVSMPAMLSLDLAPGATRDAVAMTSPNLDRQVLRELADGGNETALDRLADLADADGDVEQLSELLDEGCMRAGSLLTRRAVAAGDLRELQRICDAGFDRAGEELERLLRTPTTE